MRVAVGAIGGAAVIAGCVYGMYRADLQRATNAKTLLGNEKNKTLKNTSKHWRQRRCPKTYHKQKKVKQSLKTLEKYIKAFLSGKTCHFGTKLLAD